MTSWSGVADAYARSFATLCAGTYDRLLADTRGHDHLDVGSGTGALAVRADVLGRSVVAVDADPEMVALSAAAVPGKAMLASLPGLPFADDSFDAVTANFVVNHVGDPLASMRDLARVTRPGGRVAATIWTAQAPAWAPLVLAAFDEAGVVPVASRPLAPERDFERSVDGLRRLAQSAGLEVVVATELSWDWHVGVDALWSGIAGGVATVGQTYVAQAPDVQLATERAFRDAAAGIAENGMLSLASTAAYVVAATGREQG